MTPLGDFHVRLMRRDELAFAIELAAREGWNPGLHDAECFFEADPGGFLIGELTGQPIGCISAVSYGGCYGFVGLYIVRPEFRGRGFGMRLWQAAMSRLRGHNIGLDGVLAEQDNYAKSGFRLAYRNLRYRGRAADAAVAASVVPAAKVSFEAVCDLDRQIFPERRSAFLRAWLAQPGAGAYVAQDQGRLIGYTLVRQCREGWKIGPLVADNIDAARALYDAASAHATDGQSLFLDIPETNLTAQTLVAARDLIPVFETAGCTQAQIRRSTSQSCSVSRHSNWGEPAAERSVLRREHAKYVPSRFGDRDLNGLEARAPGEARTRPHFRRKIARGRRSGDADIPAHFDELQT